METVSPKFPLFLFLSLILANYANAQEAQTPIDSALAAQITVSGFCLCHTTVADLKHLDKNLEEVSVEEMDLGKRCLGSDSRFVNGKGYYSGSFPGMIFQKDPDNDYISKIRLTRGFRGKLPNGATVDMENLRLKDVLAMYPSFEDQWHSRGCSDFWSFSNDTISFYVRIDTTKKPQFPIDEAYYLSRPVDGIELAISCYDVTNPGDSVSLFPPGEPAFFLDSIRTNSGFLKESGITPTEIAFINVFKGPDAIARAGKDGANGVVDIITKSFAREHYWSYFKSKSADYSKRVPDLGTEAEVVYILNGKIIEKDKESPLFAINDSNFIRLEMIDGNTLEKKYSIVGKSIGVVIKTRLK